MKKPDWVKLDGLDKKARGKFTRYYRDDMLVYQHYKDSSYESWTGFDEKERMVRYENSDGVKRRDTYNEEGECTFHTEGPNAKNPNHTEQTWSVTYHSNGNITIKNKDMHREDWKKELQQKQAEVDFLSKVLGAGL